MICFTGQTAISVLTLFDVLETWRSRSSIGAEIIGESGCQMLAPTRRREREREKYSEGLRSERPETVASSRSFSFSVRVSALPLSSSFARAFIRHGGLSRKRSMRSVVCRNNRPIARENPRRWDKIAFRRVDDGASSRNRRSFFRKKKKKRTIIIL